MEKLHSRGHTAHLPTARAHRKKQLTAKGEREPNARRRRISAGMSPFLVPVGFLPAATMRGMDTLQPNAPGAVKALRLWGVRASGLWLLLDAVSSPQRADRELPSVEL